MAPVGASRCYRIRSGLTLGTDTPRRPAMDTPASVPPTRITPPRRLGFGRPGARKVSGKSRDGRDELTSILDFIRPGDELVVVKLDRLGRNTRDVLALVHELDQKGAGLRVLESEFSTSTDTGRILVTVLGMVAEMERNFIRSRQQAGIEVAKK